MEGVPDHALRVTATGGGCCGPSYEIMIDDKAGDGDIIVEKNGARLFVDEATSKKLDGAELGFVSDERGEGFVLGFPNGAPVRRKLRVRRGRIEAALPWRRCGSGGCACG